MAVVLLQHPDGFVRVEERGWGKRYISVELTNPELFMERGAWLTRYPVTLIQKMLALKGPAYLCDEIMRDEDPSYAERTLRYGMLGYIQPTAFQGKRMLDFGCGSGSSTMILSRLFPDTEITGIELERPFVEIARARAHYYGATNTAFIHAHDPDALPPRIGAFDFIVLSEVYEHLLPHERRSLLPLLWNVLNPGGVIFLIQTPHRFFPIETHTTSGLIGINYLPDWMAGWYARIFSKRKLGMASWESLLRQGLRGGTAREIMSDIRHGGGSPTLLHPHELDLSDEIELWYRATQNNRRSEAKKLLYYGLRMLKNITGITLVPYISVAIKK